MGRVAGLTADETRGRVLNAAAEVFAECGFDGARVAQIAKVAGLSVGAIYNHYDSKAELLAAVVERHSADEIGRLLAEGKTGGVLDLIVAKGRRLDRGPLLAPLLAEVIVAARRDPDAAKVLAREVLQREQLLADVVRLSQAAGDVADDVDADAIARFCLMLGLGSLLVRAMDLPSTSADAWTSVITRLVDSVRPPQKEPM
jgi:AcrR family transcriptional regulator